MTLLLKDLIHRKVVQAVKGKGAISESRKPQDSKFGLRVEGDLVVTGKIIVGKDGKES